MTKTEFPPVHDGELLRVADMLRLLRVAKTTLYQWVNQGILPPPSRVGKLSYWNAREVHERLKTVAPGLYTGAAILVRQE